MRFQTPPSKKTAEIETLRRERLNYHFSRKAGKLTIKWVDTLAEHLVLDQKENRLSIFRFPVVCLPGIRKEKYRFAARIANWAIHPSAREPEGSDEEYNPHDLYREVLASYSLLFKDAKSHGLLCQELSSLASSGKLFDPFAAQLTEPEPSLLAALISWLGISKLPSENTLAIEDLLPSSAWHKDINAFPVGAKFSDTRPAAPGASTLCSEPNGPGGSLVENPLVTDRHFGDNPHVYIQRRQSQWWR
ncbi:hypothetical protein BDW74DRAFT_175695 [Aspergillus multicolor]|uniref:uncharacterized protein n=1 Tax=Aspergillus multicolor TaxID=41759 RepID=UPI003CCD00CE